MPELHDLEAPAPADDFRERLFERAEAVERSAARRWRAVALAATCVAVAAVTAAGVTAFGGGAGAVNGVFDRTMSCAPALQGGVPVARLTAHARYDFVNNGQSFSFPSVAALMDKDSQPLGSVGAAPHGYGFAGNRTCTKAPSLSLTHKGLPLYDVYKTGQSGIGAVDQGAQCLVGAKVRVRLRVVVDSRDVPTSGRLAMWTGQKKLRPVAFVDWEPKRVTVYMSDDCRT